ncbi:MAG: proteasome assembly chaperone family protein [Nitrososphaeraceae archaeon]
MPRQIMRTTGKTIVTAHSDIDNNHYAIESKTRVKPLSKVIQRNKKLNSPILIAGFPGPGLVGSISTSYIIDKLNMYQIACVESEHIAPGVIYVGGKLRHPFRLYSNKEGNVCVLVCEAPIMIQGMYSVLNTVMKWGLDNRVKEVMVLDGIAVEGLPDSKRTPMILSSDGKSADAANLLHDDSNNNTTDNNINPADKNRQEPADGAPFYANTAFIGGIAGGLLSACLSNGIACKALLVLASSGIPDPEGAAILLESVAKTTNDETLRIDTQKLREQGANVKRRMEEIMRSIREQQQQQQQYQQQQQQQQQQTQGQTHVGQDIMYG